MTANNSLELSEKINTLMRNDLLGLFKRYYPEQKIKELTKNKGRRDRVYNEETTLLSMIVTASLEDKSLQNSVNQYSRIHSNNIAQIQKTMAELMEKEREQDKLINKKKGRPKKYKINVAKSKLDEISTNTGSYTTARQRLDIELVKMVFEESANFETIKTNNIWKGKQVYITDGTYLQMQDSNSLREIYEVKSTSQSIQQGYPQGLLQVVIEQGSGAIKYFELGNRHVSELELISKLINKIRKGTLILADDLYNSYAIFELVKQNGLEIIVPGKRERNYKVIRKIAEGDEIIELKKTNRPKWLSKEITLSDSLQMRRLSFENPENPGVEYVLYTTILDASIEKTNIVLKYFTRWDVEISIREIKQIMGINVLRSKSPEMVLKELMVSMIAYNLIRKIIAESALESAFSPETDIIQKYFEAGKAILIDKKGRIYNRWSPGRNGYVKETDIKAYNS